MKMKSNAQKTFFFFLKKNVYRTIQTSFEKPSGFFFHYEVFNHM